MNSGYGVSDQESRAEAARKLAAARRRLFLARSILGLVVPAAIWASGLSELLWRLAESLPGGPWPGLMVFSLVLLTLLAIVELPLSWYGGYRLAHRFGLSRQSLGAWFADWLKGLLLGAVLGTAALVVLYSSIWIGGEAWWWLFGIAASLAILVLTFVAPYVLVPIFYRMRRLEDAALVAAVQRLATAARTEVREVCTLDFSRKTVEANAAVLGFGRSRRVVLADTLLSQFNRSEVEAVVAHELGHHVRRDIARLLLLQGGLLWLGLVLAALYGERLLMEVGATGGLGNPANLPLLLLAADFFGLATLPVSNALSRRIEAAADRFALDLTGDPSAFAAAMRKLADQNLAEARPPRWAEILLYTHPPIATRIERAEARGRGTAA